MALTAAGKKYAIDLAERVVATFAAATVAVVLAAGPADFFNLSVWQVAAVAGLAAAGSLLKGIAASFIGKRDSASLSTKV